MRRPFARLIALPLALVVLPACGHAQREHALPSQALPMPTLVFPTDSAYVDLPMRIDRNHVVLPVRIGSGGAVDCILDTGARGTVLFGDSVVKALGLVPLGQARIRGAGGGADSVHTGSLYMGVDFHAGGLAIRNSMLVTMSEADMARSPLHGLLAMGRGLLEQCVAEIDWDAQHVRFHDPERFHYSGPGVVVPLTFDAAGQPFARVRVAFTPDSSYEFNLVLDTGASHAVQLEPGSNPHIHAPQGVPRERIGLGASGVVMGWVGRAATVELGGVTFHDVPVTYPDETLGMGHPEGRNGNLGSALLRRFRVYLDLGQRRMILEPGPHVHDPIVLPPQE